MPKLPSPSSKRPDGSLSETPSQAAAPEYVGAQPVGQGDYVVGQGDCMSSIAKKKGYFWESIWNDAANSELKTARKNPNALLPGDRVTLATKKPKQDAGATEMRHRFVRRGEPSFLRIKLIDVGGAPRTGVPYKLTIDGDQREGSTDGDGKINEPIPGNAERAVLQVEEEGMPVEVYQLKLGAVDPVRAVSGMQSRLNNMGYPCGPVDGKIGPKTLGALNRFRGDVGLPPSAEVDDDTLTRLEQCHDQMESNPRPDQPPTEAALDESNVEMPAG